MPGQDDLRKLQGEQIDAVTMDDLRQEHKPDAERNAEREIGRLAREIQDAEVTGASDAEKKALESEMDQAIQKAPSVEATKPAKPPSNLFPNARKLNPEQKKMEAAEGEAKKLAIAIFSEGADEDVPQWYTQLQLANVLNCPPWEIAPEPSRDVWKHRARVAVVAEQMVGFLNQKAQMQRARAMRDQERLMVPGGRRKG